VQSETAQPGGDAGAIESGMDRVAGPGMVEREGQQRFGRQAAAGPAQSDARWRQVPQVRERAGWRWLGFQDQDRDVFMMA
jgi:hypothetical protein